MTSKLAFYAPMKPPNHRVPSGDRRFARLLRRALGQAGFQVDLASTLSSRNGKGDPARQDVIERRAKRSLTAVLNRYRDAPPDIWVTYHLYHKAPDLLGPAVCEAFGTPYVVVEASTTPRQANGPWARGHSLAAKALKSADLILQPNPKDLPCVDDLTGGKVRQETLLPFLDVAAEQRETQFRERHRADWSEILSLDASRPWMLAVGMMREGAKTQSYKLLAQAAPLDVPLILVGDGPERSTVEHFFSNHKQVRFTGALDQEAIRTLYATADLFAWPAIDEAFGLASLEAQAAGLPCILGDRPGIRAMTAAGETALLVPEGDAEAFSVALLKMLDDPTERASLGEKAAQNALMHHDIASAAAQLRTSLTPLIRGKG